MRAGHDSRVEPCIILRSLKGRVSLARTPDRNGRLLFGKEEAAIRKGEVGWGVDALERDQHWQGLGAARHWRILGLDFGVSSYLRRDTEALPF